ncbi:MAG: hypothetical protein ICV59_09045 [Thermoleophilia bacterium]|nr:hypothetical protein [Thermoleophilia bacterium]
MPAQEVEKEIDRLYGLPLDEFVSARNEAARRLKKSGHADEASRVQALRKPTVAVWLVNQLARQEKGGVRQLLGAAKSMREAHGKQSGALQAAVIQEREAVAELVAAARDLAARNETQVSEAVLERVATTLHAAAALDEARPLLERGLLTEEMETVGFGALSGVALSPPPERPATPPPKAERGEAAAPAKADSTRRAAEVAERRRLAEQRKRVRELRERERQLRQEVRAAERAVRDARRAAEAAERDLAELSAELERVGEERRAIEGAT